MATSPAPEICARCRRKVRWEWIPAVFCAGKPLAGTGTWRRPVVDGLCSSCQTTQALQVAALRRERELKRRIVALFGSERPYREFTLERYEAAAGNRLALGRAIVFSPARDNLYLWGPCGVGKTHLAYAIALRELSHDRDAAIGTVPQLIRKLRMRPPEEEQNGVERLVRVDVLVLDDLGIGTDTAYSRQILQEVLDGRRLRGRAGLVVTSRYGLGALAEKLNDDTISSRLAGMCHVVEIPGPDHRLIRRPQSGEIPGLAL